MKKTLLIFAALASFLFIACPPHVEPVCPAVDIKLVSATDSSITVGWNDVGDEYYYSVSCGKGTEKVWISGGETFVDTEWVTIVAVSETTDTVFSVDGLSPDTEYVISVTTGGPAMSNSTTARFRTKSAN